MSEAQIIVRILPLNDLLRSIIRKQSEFGGRMPSRVIACRTQIQKWADEALPPGRGLAPGKLLTIMSIPVVDGGDGCQPELVWAQAIEASA